MSLPCIEIPTRFETERLVIRASRPGDGREANAAILETWEELHTWMVWAREKPTVRQSEAHARESLRSFQAREELQYRMFLKNSNTMVGSSGLHRIDWGVPRFEIGYWCRKSFQGQGYITETVRGLSVLAFDALRAARVEIRCDSRNTPSRRVAERAGYKLDGLFRNDMRDPEGALRDTLVFSMIREEFEARRASITRGVTGVLCQA